MSQDTKTSRTVVAAINLLRRGNPKQALKRLEKLIPAANQCEECDMLAETDNGMCLKCDELHFCECGQRLEDSYGSPGDGLCRKCS